MDAVSIDTNEPSQTADDEPVDQHDDICRICLTTSVVMRNLFIEDDVVSLSTKLMACTNIKMIPDDGLPTQLCCDCADKLETAYELKLQAEHADNTLRGKLDKWSVKDEFFFNEVEVHLDNERSVDKNYENNKKQQEQQQQHQQIDCHDKNNLMEVQEDLGNDHDHHDDCSNTCKTENYNVPESITIGEHNYMVQQDYSLTNEEQDKILEQDSNHDTTDYTVIINENVMDHQNEMIDDEKNAKNPLQLNNSGSDNNETNYFENLSLSCRLKQANIDKKKDINKIFFMCFICDKQFTSKNSIKEHMNSHDEIRNKLPEQIIKSPLQPPLQPLKSTSSGKKLNKCPYCGKEYLYVISFKKHLKQHENSDDVIGQTSISQLSNDQEINFNSDNDFDNTDGTFEVITDDRDDNDDDDDDNDDNNCTYTGTLEANQVNAEEEKSTNIITTTDQATCSTNDNLNKHIILNETQLNIKMHTSDNDSDLLKNSTQFNIDNNEFIEDNLQKELNKNNEGQLENLLTTNDNSHDDGDDDDNGDNINKKINKQETIIESRLPKIKYRCKICLQEFHKKDELSSHANEHAALKNIYKCTECNKNFGNELTLRNHLIATNHRTIIQGSEYDPNKRIKRVAAKAAQKIIDKIKIENDDDDIDYNDKKPIITTTTTATATTNLCSSEKLLLAIKNKTYNFGNNKRDIECESCGKKCSSKQYLIKHMEHHVREEKLMQQDDDNKKVKKIIDTNTKEQISKKTNWNTFNMQNDLMNTDDDEDDDDDEFDNCMNWPMDNHECPTCKKRYSTKKSLLRHQLLHDDPNYECDICNVKFYRKDKLKAHYDKCSEKNPDQVRKCNICGDIFENNEILREHRSKHVDEGILTEEDLRELEPTSDDKTNNEKIPRKRRTDIVGLECTECNKQYTSRKGLLRHIQVHEGKKYLCDICPKKFYRREHLKIHVAKHNMIKPYKCSRCSKRFIKEEQLSQHLTKHERTVKNKIKDTDSNSKRFLCEICSKSFTQSTTLVAHLRAHNGIKPFVCEVCARPFTTNAYLKMHMRTHTNERPYTCEYCSRAFARADTLANHLTSHTGEAKYLCKYCPKKFRRLKSLKEHVFIHTGQRPYACPTCDRRFNNNGSRYAHSKRCKQNLMQSVAAAQEPNQTNIIEIQTLELPQQHQQQLQQHQQDQQDQQDQQNHHHQQHHHQQLLQQQQQQQEQHQQQLDDNGDDMQLHNNSLQQQTQQIQVQIQQEPHPTHIHCAVNNTMQVVQNKGLKTITLRPDLVTSHQLIQQDNNISLPYLPLTILPLTVALTDDDEVILPEGAKLFTTTQ